MVGAALPSGVTGLVWLGRKSPTAADAAFRATVGQLASSPKVFGYYLSDEPHVSDCPGVAAALRGAGRTTSAPDRGYGWGNQSSSSPTLVDSADLQTVCAAHNGVVTR